jgi:hypothetical protein
MSYASQLGKKCDQNEYCSNEVEVYRPNAGRVTNWPFPRLSTSAAEIRRQQTSFGIDAVSPRTVPRNEAAMMRRLRRPAIVIKRVDGDSPHYSVSVNEMNAGEERLAGVIHVHGDRSRLRLDAAPVMAGHVMIMLSDIHDASN